MASSRSHGAHRAGPEGHRNDQKAEHLSCGLEKRRLQGESLEQSPVLEKCLQESCGETVYKDM